MAEARKQLAELVNRAAFAKERFVLTRHGRELVAIVPKEDLDLLERLRRFASRREVQAALRDIGVRGGTSWEQIKTDLGL